MQDDIALLGLALQVREPLPVHKILRTGNPSSSNCRGQVSRCCGRVLALHAENAVNPAVLVGGETHIVNVGRRLTVLRHSDRTVPETEIVHSVRALCHREERFAVSGLDTYNKDVFSVPFDSAAIHRSVDAEAFHQIWIGHRIEVITPEKRGVFAGDYRVFVTLENSIAFNRLIFSCNEGFVL